MKKFLFFLLLCSSCVSYSQNSVITLDGSALTVEIADTEESQEKGLMFRKELPENSGMLFVLKRPRQMCMWMKNTFIPLSVAFINAQGNIVNIEHMAPLTENIHCSNSAVAYALEVNQGWFAKNRIGVGSYVGNLPR